MSKSDLRIDWATHEAAKYACQNWHYSKCMSVGKLVKIGVWEKGKFIGAIIFSRGASPNLLKPYGLKQTDGCELTRVALAAHKVPVSRIVKIAVIFLKKLSDLKLVVSFADPQKGHHGGIYQAGNWIYTGAGTAKPRLVLVDGTTRHNRLYQGRNKTKIPSGAYWSKPTAKHRYLMPLTKEMRQKIMPLSKPYPKRTPVEDHPGPPDDGGSTPTRSLQ